MRIALDYDLTFSADKDMWVGFIFLARGQKHDVRIVTMRSKELDWHEDFDLLAKIGVETIFCDGQPKQDVCIDHEWLPDIWIDDMPKGIYEGSQYTKEQLDEWRRKDKENKAA